MNKLKWVLLFAVLVLFMQWLFIAAVPSMVFAIAKHRAAKPMNTVIHAGKTDASLRRVVLPNPDFIYSACFYDVSDNDLMITGTFPDSTHYVSVAFYNDQVQPYKVLNNLQGRGKKFSVRLSSKKHLPGSLRAETKQGAVLLRVLLRNSMPRDSAQVLQQSFKARVVSPD